MPVPTPGRAAIWRIGASTPEVTNASAAAPTTVCRLRWASARLPRDGGSPIGLPVVITRSFQAG
ncbi:hypothetical protein ACFY3N_20350 [Streptomyces sp. NPDC000348]|uniref:hypothetical protein n=1 Tax=Streptomyces sp. NPDC000348 TaxID=3364538 RepID=UPI0036A9FD33